MAVVLGGSAYRLLGEKDLSHSILYSNTTQPTAASVEVTEARKKFGRGDERQVAVRTVNWPA
jgi:hypothetical protein